MNFRLSHIFVSALLAVVLAGCDTDGPAERAGEGVDRAVDRTGDAVENAGDRVREGTDR